MSMQSLISCLNPKDWGCKDGVIETAMQYMEKTGIVTETCFPYSS